MVLLGTRRCARTQGIPMNSITARTLLSITLLSVFLSAAGCNFQVTSAVSTDPGASGVAFDGSSERLDWTALAQDPSRFGDLAVSDVLGWDLIDPEELISDWATLDPFQVDIADGSDMSDADAERLFEELMNGENDNPIGEDLLDLIDEFVDAPKREPISFSDLKARYAGNHG